MNQVPNRALAALAGLLAVGLAGCGSSQYVSVSGVITLNGKPYRNAVVQFLPVASQEHPNPGRGSSGKTDEHGRFTLKSADGYTGAVVGKHRVRISTVYSNKLQGYDVWDADANKAVKAVTDPIPPEWNSTSKKEFEVPPGGTDKANFDISTKRAGKR
jgi:hypothetical protein